MDYNNYLRAILVGESKAYGFTIGFWSSGMVLVMMDSMNDFLNVFSFGLGAVIGFGILSLVAFRGVLKTATVEQNEFMVLSTVHYFAALVPMVLTYLILSYVPGNTGLLLAGISVSLSYNLLILVQETIAEKISELSVL